MTQKLPVLTNETLKAFADTNNTKGVLPIPTGRFIVPIPKLNDGGGDLKLPNSKRQELIIESGEFGTKIKSATFEGAPQLIPTDGTQVVVINNVTRRQGLAMKAIYDDIFEITQVDRKGLLEFFGAVTGISYNTAKKKIEAVNDNIGIHGDVHNMSRQIFKNNHNSYGMELDLNDLPDDKIRRGMYQKKRTPSEAFAISGGFIRQAETGSLLEYPETAMVQINPAGVISTISNNDINTSYETSDGKKLVGSDGKIDLPTYPVGQVLLAGRNAPPLGGAGLERLER